MERKMVKWKEQQLDRWTVSEKDHHWDHHWDQQMECKKEPLRVQM